MPPRIPIKTIRKIRKEIRKGKSRRQLSKELNLSVDTVCRYAKHITPGPLNKKLIEILRKDIELGKTKKQISYEYGLTYETVKKHTKGFGISFSRLTNEQINNIRDMVRGRTTKKQISEETGISLYSVRNHTKDISLWNSIPVNIQQKIKDDWKNGKKSKKQIANDYKVSDQTVEKYIIDYQRYRRYSDVPQHIIDEIRAQVKQGKSKMQVSRDLRVSYPKVKLFTRDTNKQNKKSALSQNKIKKIKHEIINGKTKIQVAREMNIPVKLIYNHTQDIITSQVHDTKLSGKTYELLEELMKHGYAMNAKKFTYSHYQKLRLKFPNIQRVKMYGRVIYFLEDNAELAAKAFLQNIPKKITGYHELKQVIDVFKTDMKNDEKKEYIRKN